MFHVFDDHHLTNYEGRRASRCRPGADGVWTGGGPHTIRSPQFEVAGTRTLHIGVCNRGGPLDLSRRLSSGLFSVAVVAVDI